MSDAVAVPAASVAASSVRQGPKRARWIIGAGLLIVALIAVGLWLFRQATPPLPASEDAPSTPLAVDAVAQPAPSLEMRRINAPQPDRQASQSDAAVAAQPGPSLATPVQIPSTPTPRPITTATPPPVVAVDTAPASSSPPISREEPPALVVTPPSPPPTSAERAPSDPDAPVATRPQPLD